MGCWLSSTHTSAHLFWFFTSRAGDEHGSFDPPEGDVKKKRLLFSAFANELPNSACACVCVCVCVLVDTVFCL